MNHISYADAGFRVFGLYGAANGKCECGNEGCQALYKHPRIRAWQHTPHWSDEQLDVMEQTGQFKTGFGVLCDGYLVIDIDPRNGGNDGYDKLVKDTGIDFKADAGFVVSTGGGGWHIYYKANGGALMSHHKDYKGIDFKSSGFVVGAGSQHVSGNPYEVEEGWMDDVTVIPSVLADLLTKWESHKIHVDGVQSEITNDELTAMLAVLSPNCNYDDWIAIGMALHDATGGNGFDLWDDWSARGDTYKKDEMDLKWHSFGKSNSPITVATLIMKARDAGYVEPVTFDSVSEQEPVIEDDELAEHPVDISDIDLLRPQPNGFVGDVVDWMNNQCRYPRERLTVASALVTLGNIGGFSHEDVDFGTSGNLFAFLVAGSSTGKEAVQQAQAELFNAAGHSLSLYGSIKSEQEIVRNLVSHQPSNYIIDEFGIFLSKLTNAAKKGGTSYLEAVIGVIMSAYSKATGRYIISGDLTKDLIKELNKELSMANKSIDENDNVAFNEQRRDATMQMINDLTSGGLVRPYMSLAGYTTPSTFNDAVNQENTTNGFVGRALLAKEPNDNPRSKRKFKRQDMPSSLRNRLLALAGGGSADMLAGQRIEHRGALVAVSTSVRATAALDKILTWFEDYSEQHMEHTGMHPVIRRGFEMVLKISFILGMCRETKERTLHDVRWAYALVRRDIDDKVALAMANVADDIKDTGNALMGRILAILDTETGITEGVIANRYRKYNKKDIHQALTILESNGHATKVFVKKYKGKETFKWYKK